MSVGWIFLWLLLIVALPADLYLMVRNRRVLRFRAGILARTSAAAKADIAAGRYEWQWRYREFERVPYGRMVISVRRLREENYWTDTRFLDPAFTESGRH